MSLFKNFDFNNFIENKVGPIAGKVGSQRHVTAIRDAFMTTVPFIIIGSFMLVLAFPPLGENATDIWSAFANEHRAAILVPFSYTMGMMTLWVVGALAYSLSRNYKGIDPVMASLLSLSTFFMISAPINDGGLSTTFMDGKGVFTGILIGIFVPELMMFLDKHNIGFKLPPQVPEKIRHSFNLLIPLFLIVAVIVPFNLWLVDKTGHIIPELIMELLKPLVSASDSLWALMLVIFVAQLLWWAGVHGTSITSGVIAPFTFLNLTANQTAFKSGVPGDQLPTILTDPLLQFFLQIGGSGSTFALVLLMIKSRSTHLKAIGRLSVIPGMFNINEPVTFGTPIVMNPTLFIPWVFGPLVSCIITWTAFSTGFVHRIIAVPPWTTPAPIGAMWATNWAIEAIFIVFVNLIVAGLIYWPFFRTYEKQLISQEKA